MVWSLLIHICVHDCAKKIDWSWIHTCLFLFHTIHQSFFSSHTINHLPHPHVMDHILIHHPSYFSHQIIMHISYIIHHISYIISHTSLFIYSHTSSFIYSHTSSLIYSHTSSFISHTSSFISHLRIFLSDFRVCSKELILIQWVGFTSHWPNDSNGWSINLHTTNMMMDECVCVIWWFGVIKATQIIKPCIYTSSSNKRKKCKHGKEVQSIIYIKMIRFLWKHHQHILTITKNITNSQKYIKKSPQYSKKTSKNIKHILISQFKLKHP